MYLLSVPPGHAGVMLGACSSIQFWSPDSIPGFGDADMEAQRGRAVCLKSHSIWTQISLILSAVIGSSLVSSQAGWETEVGSELAPARTEGTES